MKVQSYLKSVSSNAHIMQPAYNECDTIEQSDKRFERMRFLKEKKVVKLNKIKEFKGPNQENYICLLSKFNKHHAALLAICKPNCSCCCFRTP